MSQLDSLGWWFAHLPLCLEDVSLTDDERTRLCAAYRQVASIGEDAVKLLADICLEIDKWMEGNQLDESPFVGHVHEEKALCLIDCLVTLLENRDDAGNLYRAVRTLLLGLKKWSINDDSGDADHAAVYDDFISRQSSLRDLQLLHGVTQKVLVAAQALLKDVLEPFESEILEARVHPGPGSVYEGWCPIQKWGRLNVTSWYFAPLFAQHDWPETSLPRELGEHPLENLGTSRLCCVFKSLKVWRLITVEPNENAMAQQVCRSAMLSCMRMHPLTRHLKISGSDAQSSQQERARSGSRGGSDTLEVARVENPLEATMEDCFSESTAPSAGWELSQVAIKELLSKLVLSSTAVKGTAPATLDMKDASDLITNELVQFLFPPKVYRALASCRSFFFERPDTKRVYAMRSYAGMGNATTFVVETLVFWAVTYAVYALWSGMTVDQMTKAHKAARRVCVYGDDIICPTDFVNYSNLFEVYQDLGWVLNKHKSFYRLSGKFRESCGLHCWNGYDVTPYRFSGYDVLLLQHQFALSDLLYRLVGSYPTLARAVWDESSLANTHHKGVVWHGQFPFTGWHEWPERNPPPVRWSHTLCAYEVSYVGLVARRSRTQEGFWELLLAWFCGCRIAQDYRVVKTIRSGSLSYKKRSFRGYSAPMPKSVCPDRTARWHPADGWGLPDEGVQATAELIEKYAPRAT